MKVGGLCCLAGSAMIAFTFSAVQVCAGEPIGNADIGAIGVSGRSESANNLGTFSIANLHRGHASDVRIADGISLRAGSTESRIMPVRCPAQASGARHDANCLSNAGGRRIVWSYASLDIRFSEDVAAYIRTGRSFRIGANQLRTVGLIGSVDTSISDRPEVRFEHEAGVRSDMFDGKLGVNFAAYYNKVKASQETLTLATATGTRFSSFINPTTVRNMGLEADLTLRPTGGLSLYGSLAANREKFKICAGGFCPGHARDIMQTEVNLGADFQRELAIGTLGLNLNCNWTGRGRVVTSTASTSRFGQAFGRRSATTVDARVTLSLANSPIELYAYGRNLTDHRFMQHGRLVQDSASVSLLNTPRTTGLGLAMAF